MNFETVQEHVAVFWNKNRRDVFRCPVGTKMTREACRNMQAARMAMKVTNEEQRRQKRACRDCTMREGFDRGFHKSTEITS